MAHIYISDKTKEQLDVICNDKRVNRSIVKEMDALIGDEFQRLGLSMSEDVEQPDHTISGQ